MNLQQVFADYAQYLPLPGRQSESIAHKDYPFTVEHAHKLAIHALQVWPEQILDSYRPGEDEAINIYRKKAYECPTYFAWCKVENVLSRIKEAEDFRVDYSVIDGNELRAYADFKLPYTDSIKEWLFKVLLKVMLRDPNAVMVVLAEESETGVPDNTYQNVYPHIFESENVVYYEEREVCILRDKEYFYIITNEQTSKHKIGKDGKIDMAGIVLATYQMDNMPAERLGGNLVTECHEPQHPIFTSFIAGVLPQWNKAVRLSSDLDACLVLHAFPQRQRITQRSKSNLCTTCNGTKLSERVDKEGTLIQAMCISCGGTGYSVGKNSPFNEVTVELPDNFNPVEQTYNVSLPIAMYTTPDIQSPKFLEEVRDREINKGFVAINMEFLGIGANQSGIAKEYDRTELNTMLEQVAGQIVYMANQAYYYINVIRHPIEMVTRPEVWKSWLPTIQVPKSFDRITSMTALSDLSAAKQAGAGASTIQALEERVESSQFRGNIEQLAYLNTLREMAPLPGISTDALTMGMSDGTIRKEDAYLQNNLHRLVHQANAENKGFYGFEFKEKQAILYSMIKSEMFVSEGLNPDGTDPAAVITVQTGGVDKSVVDIEAEAQAKLRGTVGAFSGIREVAAGISEGRYSYESGIYQLEKFLGLSNEDAKKVLDGTAKDMALNSGNAGA